MVICGGAGRLLSVSRVRAGCVLSNPRVGGKLDRMTWGDSLGVQSRHDVEALTDAGLRAAARVLDTGRWLRPIPLAITFAGTVEELDSDAAALERRTPAALTSAAIYLLAQHAPQSRAVALVTGSRLTAEGRPAEGRHVIEVWVEHRDGEALTVLQPYRRDRGRPQLDAPRAYTGSRLIWATNSAA